MNNYNDLRLEFELLKKEFLLKKLQQQKEQEQEHNGLAGAQIIRDYFDKDKFCVFIVEGRNGSGKTAYCNTLISEVYSKDGVTPNWDINLFKRLMGFHPKEVLKAWKNQKQREYCYHWDDAGVWLANVDHQNAFVKSIGKYLQTARTQFGVIMFSCISRSDIVAKLRNFDSCYIVSIADHSDSTSPYPSHRHRASAQGWHYWENRLDRKGTENDWFDGFCSWMPDKFYQWYKPLREHYCRIQQQLMEQTLKRQKDIMKVRIKKL